MPIERLSDYPYVVVHVTCTFCPRRRGRYRLARLAARFGPEAKLWDVLVALSESCPHRHARGNQYVQRCHAYYADLLDSAARLPDLPPDVDLLEENRPLPNARQSDKPTYR